MPDPESKDGMALDTEDLTITVESSAAWARRLRITVPASRIAKERQNAVARIAKQARLPGFRKGKVPASVVQKRFGAAIEQETLERVMGDAYREAIQRENLQPITDGSIDNVQYESGTDLTFDVGFEVRPQVELERLGGFTIRRPPTLVEDEQVDRVLDRLRDEHATWSHVTDEAPAVGDQVGVEITPLDDTVETAPTARRYDIVLGEGHAVPAIEEVIRTLKPGEENEFTVDLPESADDPESPVRPHRVRIRLEELKRAEKPDLDDAFAQAMGEFESVDALRARIREDLGREAEREGERAVRHQLIAHLLDANPVDTPESMVGEYLRRIVPDREDADPARLAEIRDSARPAAEFGIRRMLVIERVAEMESLTVSGAELDARVADIAERMGRPAAELKATLHKNGRLAELAQEMLEEKVFDYLKSLSTIE
jgi:trigger factor